MSTYCSGWGTVWADTIEELEAAAEPFGATIKDDRLTGLSFEVEPDEATAILGVVRLENGSDQHVEVETHARLLNDSWRLEHGD